MKLRTLQLLVAFLMVLPAPVAFAGAGDADSAEKSKDLAAEVEQLKAQVAAIQKEAQHAEDYVAISNLQTAYGYYVDYYKGWDQGGNPAPGAIQGMPPDQPTTVAYKLYPDVFVPPYHYKNPVTNR